MKKTVISAVVVIAAVVALVISMAFLLPVSAHTKSTTTQQPSPAVHCGAIVAGAKKQPCLPTLRIVPLHFTNHWSQQVWVPQVWSFRYICDGRSAQDAFDILDEYNATLHSTAWEVYMRLIPLNCNNKWHTEVFHFRYAHIIVIGVSRPVTGVVGR